MACWFEFNRGDLVRVARAEDTFCEFPPPRLNRGVIRKLFKKKREPNSRLLEAWLLLTFTRFTVARRSAQDGRLCPGCAVSRGKPLPLVEYRPPHARVCSGLLAQAQAGNADVPWRFLSPAPELNRNPWRMGRVGGLRESLRVPGVSATLYRPNPLLDSALIVRCPKVGESFVPVQGPGSANPLTIGTHHILSSLV
jgi:hypothetical protein